MYVTFYVYFLCVTISRLFFMYSIYGIEKNDSSRQNIVVYRTCVFINGMRTRHLTYWTYAQIDVDFANHMQCLRSCVWRVIFQRIRLLKNISPVTSLRLYSFSQLFSNQKNGGMYLFLDVAYICTITGQSGKKIPPFIWYQEYVRTSNI